MAQDTAPIDFKGIGAPWIAGGKGVSRQPSNPYDKATIISIFPKKIFEKKVGIFPTHYVIPAGTFDKPSILHVSSASAFQEIHEGMPQMELPQSALHVADAVVRDYINALMEYSTDSHPGLFYIPGKHSAEFVAQKDAVIQIEDSNVSLLKLREDALEKQRNWFARLVKQADTIWARSNGNPMALNEDMRMAATELGLTTKPWMSDIQTMAMQNCPFCGTLRQNSFPVCANCHHVIDKARYEELNGPEVPVLTKAK